jgi:hypothetical protein
MCPPERFGYIKAIDLHSEGICLESWPKFLPFLRTLSSCTIYIELKFRIVMNDKSWRIQKEWVWPVLRTYQIFAWRYRKICWNHQFPRANGSVICWVTGDAVRFVTLIYDFSSRHYSLFYNVLWPSDVVSRSGPGSSALVPWSPLIWSSLIYLWSVLCWSAFCDLFSSFICPWSRVLAPRREDTMS